MSLLIFSHSLATFCDSPLYRVEGGAERTKVQAAASVLPNDMLETCYTEPKLLGLFNF